MGSRRYPEMAGDSSSGDMAISSQLRLRPFTECDPGGIILQA